MEIALNKLESIVDKKILRRGLSYFQNARISNFVKTSNDEYQAIVLGEQEYTIELKIHKNTIIEHHCNCPYDMGPVCKHIVAVIFYLKQEDKLIKPINKQIEKLLKIISHEELINFVQINIKKDQKFRNCFLSSFSHLNEKSSKEFYQKQIHSILQAAKGKDDWIDYSDMRYLIDSLESFFENAKNHLTRNNFKEVFFISTSLLEEMTKALQYGDDSDGDLGYFIDVSIELLTEISQNKLSNELRKNIFNYCISAFTQKLFEGWDWHLGILKVTFDLIKEEKEANIVLSCLHTINTKYQEELAQSFELDLLKLFKSEKEIEEYIDKNISNPEIRTTEITKAFTNKNFEKVITLSKNGIKHDTESRPGLTKDWYSWLLKVAQTQNNIPNIIEYAKILFIDNYSFKKEYYQILKNTIENENWYPFLEELIKELALTNRWDNIELIRNIYIKEKWWDRLFILLKQNPSMNNIEENERYLSKYYSLELIELYQKSILDYVSQFIGRKHYQIACKYLRRMKKLGGNEKVNELIQQLRQQYPQRRALIDELKQV
ncbi:MAG: Unknown protein [uncultured Campylobacterales bacterium]|uniref:SWIM-type domain-containing protein n=1 Tax=uncultured Campylobacterales bacterium TaxID=352960 RepID=A0A6S6S717_9BACT|nr:MAG: Unknown protein [uncultured Campylobacterales bacterium]